MYPKWLFKNRSKKMNQDLTLKRLRVTFTFLVTSMLLSSWLFRINRLLIRRIIWSRVIQSNKSSNNRITTTLFSTKITLKAYSNLQIWNTVAILLKTKVKWYLQMKDLIWTNHLIEVSIWQLLSMFQEGNLDHMLPGQIGCWSKGAMNLYS